MLRICKTYTHTKKDCTQSLQCLHTCIGGLNPYIINPPTMIRSRAKKYMIYFTECVLKMYDIFYRMCFKKYMIYFTECVSCDIRQYYAGTGGLHPTVTTPPLKTRAERIDRHDIFKRMCSIIFVIMTRPCIHIYRRTTPCSRNTPYQDKSRKNG